MLAQVNNTTALSLVVEDNPYLGTDFLPAIRESQPLAKWRGIKVPPLPDITDRIAALPQQRLYQKLPVILGEDWHTNINSCIRTGVTSGAGNFERTAELNDDGNAVTLSSFVMQPVWIRKIKMRWAGAYGTQVSLPSCGSLNRIVGVGNPGGDCGTCHWNRFGTNVDDKGELGKGKGCPDRVWVMGFESILDDDQPDGWRMKPRPIWLDLPQGSDEAVRNFQFELEDADLECWETLTRVSLAPKTGGRQGKQAQFRPVGLLDSTQPQFVEFALAATRMFQTMAINWLKRFEPEGYDYAYDVDGNVV